MSSEPEAIPARLFSPQSALALIAQTGARLGLAPQTIKLLTLSTFLRRNAQLASYQPTEHDLFVATFAKSGTNWMMQIGLQIAHRGEAEYRHIHDLVAWPEGPFSEIVKLEDPGPRLAAPTGLRVIKSHLNAGDVPYDPRARYVTIIRDPKEVAVSAYYFVLGQLGVLDRISPEEWLELAFDGDTSLATAWATHTAGYWAWRDKPNVRVYLFSEVNAEPERVVDEVAALMGVALTEEERAKVLNKSSFAYMKKRDAAFGPPSTPLVSKSQRPKMMRKGRSGGSDEMIDEAMAARIDAACERALLRLGSDFPYRERYGAR